MVAVLNSLPKKTLTSTPLELVKALANFAVRDETASRGILLPNVTWTTYENLTEELDGTNNPRFFYNQGELLIMPNSPEHEFDNRLISSLVEIFCEEFEINFANFGSTTYQRFDLRRGFEPDSCFYFGANEEKMRGVKRFDMSQHPAPDLVIEVDITSLSFDKLGIFASFGVPEIWRYDGEIMEIGKLDGDIYLKIETSEILPNVSAEILTEFVRESENLNRLDWQKKVRGWAREIKTKS